MLQCNNIIIRETDIHDYEYCNQQLSTFATTCYVMRFE